MQELLKLLLLLFFIIFFQFYISLIFYINNFLNILTLLLLLVLYPFGLEPFSTPSPIQFISLSNPFIQSTPRSSLELQLVNSPHQHPLFLNHSRTAFLYLTRQESREKIVTGSLKILIGLLVTLLTHFSSSLMVQQLCNPQSYIVVTDPFGHIKIVWVAQLSYTTKAKLLVHDETDTLPPPQHLMPKSSQ